MQKDCWREGHAMEKELMKEDIRPPVTPAKRIPASAFDRSPATKGGVDVSITPKAKKTKTSHNLHTTPKPSRKADTVESSGKRKNSVSGCSLEDAVHENANRLWKSSLDFSLEGSAEKSRSLAKNLNLDTIDYMRFVYQRRNKRNGDINLELSKQNQCVEKSRNIGPNFLTKKRRANRVKATFSEAWGSGISFGVKVVKKSDPKSIECVMALQAVVKLERKRNKHKQKQKQNGEHPIVPDEGEFNPLKKCKPPPRIVLNPETERVFALLMANGGSTIDKEAEADPLKKSYWEGERRSLEQKVDSFINTTSRYQGDRSFKLWGGSVVDSVVGAFLTQNTNDRLSSSAFMCLAARYPAQNLSTQDKNFQAKTNEINNQAGGHFIRLKTTAEQKNEKVIDWDKLRKIYSSEKERTEKTMDVVDWEAARRAPLAEVADTIKERGQSNIIAYKIQNFLGRLVKDHGSIDLEWLRDVPPKDAKDFLFSIYGIGVKSVECIRLLTLGHVAFPVDVNVARVAVRLGWVPLRPLPESLQLHLLEKYPLIDSIQKYLYPRLCNLGSKKLYLLHVHSIAFGKFFCTKRSPSCNTCPMRGDCKHFASAFASARLTLPAPENANRAGSNSSAVSQIHFEKSVPKSGSVSQYCDPIVELPASPVPEFEIEDIEDLLKEPHGLHESDNEAEIPTIRLDSEDLRQTLFDYSEKNITELRSGEMSNALTLFNSVATLPNLTLKRVQRLRTVHQVYELPDSHPVLKAVEKRGPDEKTPYLFAVWEEGVESGKTVNSYSEATGYFEPLEQNVCQEIVCSSCSNFEEHDSTLVYGTLMLGVRGANRGKFPLNGTYFQVNEIFADRESTQRPIAIPRNMICNLPKRLVYCGATVTSIFKGLPLEQLEHACWRGSMCIRSFDRTTRYPSDLGSRFHNKYDMQGKKKVA